VASEERPSTDLVIDPQFVVSLATRTNFKSAVGLLERLTTNTPRVGGLGPLNEEAIRFRHDPALIFASSDIRRIRIQERPIDPGYPSGPTHTVYEVSTMFLGLTGAVTPLPAYFAEEVALEDEDAPVRRDFFDIFHHRVLSLFYRARCKYDIASEFLSDGRDAWSLRILSLAGVDAFEQPPPSRFKLWRFLRLSPMLARQARTRGMLNTALEDLLGEDLENAKISIQQFVGRWVEIAEPQRMKLGISNTNLGQSTVLGRRIYDRGGKFRIKIGPLNNRNFRRFMVGGDLLPYVQEIVAAFCRDPLDYDLELNLSQLDVPPIRLSAKEPSTRLGSDSWLGSQSRSETRVMVDVPPEIPPIQSMMESSLLDGLDSSFEDPVANGETTSNQRNTREGYNAR